MALVAAAAAAPGAGVSRGACALVGFPSVVADVDPARLTLDRLCTRRPKRKILMRRTSPSLPATTPVKAPNSQNLAKLRQKTWLSESPREKLLPILSLVPSFLVQLYASQPLDL